MTAPTPYPLSILIDGNEVQSFAPFDSLDFDDNARAVSYFRMTVEKPTIAPARNDTVVISANGTTIFDGYIVELVTKKRDNGIALEYELECADKKILLQRSVMDYTELAGSDSDILTSLLANTYPDLTSEFDFSSGITSFLSDMALTTNNESLLDAINNLSDLAGGASWRMNNDSGYADIQDVDFDGGSSWSFQAGNSSGSTVQPTGNPVNCVENTNQSFSEFIYVKIPLGSSETVTEVKFDIWTNNPTKTTMRIYDGTTEYNLLALTAGVPSSTWTTVLWTVAGGSGLPSTTTEISIATYNSVGGAAIETRIDNLIPQSGGAGAPALQWSNTPDPADFDFDIQSGDEFAFDIDFFEGDIDDFNSITVIGGKEDVAIDFTYESRGDKDHFDIEAKVKDLAVFKNTGTDATPIWTAQALGIWGTDSLTSDGGTKDVLHAVEDSWLWFDSNPTDLSKTIRITGTMERPLRVRVEDVTAGDPTYATVIHDDTITSQDEAVALGDAMLKKRNSLRRVTFSTYEPNLKVGQSINIADSARGLNETLTITNIKTKWLGASGHATFSVTCGEDDLPSADIMIANNDKRSRKNAIGADINTVTTSFLVDTDGTRLADTTGDLLYEVT